MKSITQHTGTITDLKRLAGSRNGNPRFQFVVDGYTVVTPPDSSLGYKIQNYENKKVSVTIGTHYGLTTLNTITGEYNNV
jgi:hypothetical protein